jgi:asparagine synthase (glutamine-hydrolysing)
MAAIAAFVTPHETSLARREALLDLSAPPFGAVAIGDFSCCGLARAHLASDRADASPKSIDRQCWIVADARLDEYDDLCAALGINAAGPKSPDEVILAAYAKWGPACVSRLYGDFAFVIWDERRKLLFGARDRFGVQPLYYAPVENGLLVSNVFRFVFLNPAVSASINAQAISDFLLDGFNDDPATTALSDVLRVPPGHCFTWSEGRLDIQAYWTPERPGEIRYRDASQYVEHFREVLDSAVKERLDASPTAIFMSGGLDSTTIAMSAVSMAAQLKAFTVVYDSLFPDPERQFTSIAAGALSIPVRFLSADRWKMFEGWNQLWPEPPDDPFANNMASIAQCASHFSPVALSGHGGDAVMLHDWAAHFTGLAKGGGVGKLALHGLGYIAVTRRLPFLRRVAERLRGRRRRFIAPDQSLINNDLRAQSPHFSRSPAWERLQQTDGQPVQTQILQQAFWQQLFESSVPATTRAPIEVRYPFLSLRLIHFLASIPPLPWLVEKHLLRAAIQPQLPAAIRKRTKTILTGDPVLELLRREGPPNRVDIHPHLSYYIDLSAFRASLRAADPFIRGSAMRAMILNQWLHSISAAKPLR